MSRIYRIKEGSFQKALKSGDVDTAPFRRLNSTLDGALATIKHNTQAASVRILGRPEQIITLPLAYLEEYRQEPLNPDKKTIEELHAYRFLFLSDPDKLFYFGGVSITIKGRRTYFFHETYKGNFYPPNNGCENLYTEEFHKALADGSLLCYIPQEQDLSPELESSPELAP